MQVITEPYSILLPLQGFEMIELFQQAIAASGERCTLAVDARGRFMLGQESDKYPGCLYAVDLESTDPANPIGIEPLNVYFHMRIIHLFTGSPLTDSQEATITHAMRKLKAQVF